MAVNIGDVFERLTVIEPAPSRTSPSGQKKRYWVCRCECGNTKTVMQNSLVYNHTKSCGCKRKEQASELAQSGRAGWKKFHKDQGHDISDVEDWDEVSRSMDRSYVEACRREHPDKYIEVIECKSQADLWRSFSPSRSQDFIRLSCGHAPSTPAPGRFNSALIEEETSAARGEIGALDALPNLFDPGVSPSSPERCSRS
jgi:hypothetical protein